MLFLFTRFRLINRLVACSTYVSPSFATFCKAGVRVFQSRLCCFHQQQAKLNFCSQSSAEAFEDTTDSWLQQTLHNIPQLRENVQARQLKVDIKHLVTGIENLKRLQQEKLNLENQRRENAQLMKLVVKSKSSPESQQEKEKLIKRGQEIRRSLKKLMEEKYKTVYSDVMKDVLKLPTNLHPSTTEEDRILLELGSKKDYLGDVKNHLTLTKDKNVFQVSAVSNHAYYMIGNLAVLEQRIMNSISDYLRTKGLEELAGPDIVKAVIADGCGVKDHQLFSIANQYAADKVDAKSQSLVLSGVSCLVFAAYLSSLAVPDSILPLKYFAVGCGYSRDEAACDNRGLYSVQQITKADVFGATRNLQEADALFDNFLEMIGDVYRLLGLPTRFLQVAAKRLEPMEAKRVDILLWSEGFKEYIKCGELRMCNDFISRRLHMTYHQSDSSTRHFLHTVHGVVLNIPSVLACIMERHQTANISDVHLNLITSHRTKI